MRRSRSAAGVTAVTDGGQSSHIPTRSVSEGAGLTPQETCGIWPLPVTAVTDRRHDPSGPCPSAGAPRAATHRCE